MHWWRDLHTWWLFTHTRTHTHTYAQLMRFSPCILRRPPMSECRAVTGDWLVFDLFMIREGDGGEWTCGLGQLMVCLILLWYIWLIQFDYFDVYDCFIFKFDCFYVFDWFIFNLIFFYIQICLIFRTTHVSCLVIYILMKILTFRLYLIVDIGKLFLICDTIWWSKQWLLRYLHSCQDALYRNGQLGGWEVEKWDVCFWNQDSKTATLTFMEISQTGRQADR